VLGNFQEAYNTRVSNKVSTEFTFRYAKEESKRTRFDTSLIMVTVL
jgi:hypothetical protein